MTLEEALNEIEVLKLTNKKLKRRIDFLEEQMYSELDSIHDIDGDDYNESFVPNDYDDY